MKIRFLPVLFSLATAAVLQAQEPVTTGVLDAVSQEAGTLRLRADQTAQKPILFYGMNAANITTVSGKLATLADLRPGTQLTIFYVQRGDRWFISRVLIPDAEPTTGPATPPTRTTTGDGTNGTVSTARRSP